MTNLTDPLKKICLMLDESETERKRYREAIENLREVMILYSIASSEFEEALMDCFEIIDNYKTIDTILDKKKGVCGDEKTRD